MKLFATSHDHGYYRLTFMGLTLFERDAVSQVDVVHQKILGGLFSSRKENNISTGFREKIFALCGLPVCIRREGEFGREYSLAGLIIKRETWSQLLSKSSLMRSAHDANHIFLFKANSGEVFLFLRFILPSILKHSSEIRPLLVVTKHYHLDMANMICPDIPCIHSKEKILLRLHSFSYEILEKKLYVLFPATIFRSIEESLVSHKPDHYFHRAIQLFKLDNNLTGQFYIKVHSQVEKSALGKASALSLNLKKFVFLSPEAASCRLLPDDIWIHLADALRTQGYDIFVNVIQHFDLAARMGKSCMLTYQEAFVLASRAERIISLRSGFAEFLMDTQVPLDVIYTDFERRGTFLQVPAHCVFKGFTLSRLPHFVSANVREFIYEPGKEEYLLNAILQ